MKGNQLERVARSKLIKVFATRVLNDQVEIGYSSRLEAGRMALDPIDRTGFNARLTETFERSFF